MKKALIIILITFCGCCKNDNVSNSSDCEAIKFETSNLNGDIVYIKDKLFEGMLIKYDSDKKVNGQIFKNDALKIDSINISGRRAPEQVGIKSIKGIEYFENLKFFKCFFEDIDTLDLRKNTKLEYLEFTGYSGGGGYIPQGKYIILGENKNLKNLKVKYTLISQINIKGLINLSELDLVGNQNLQYIYIDNPNLVKNNWLKDTKTIFQICK